jgi:hypothetical protein
MKKSHFEPRAPLVQQMLPPPGMTSPPSMQPPAAMQVPAQPAPHQEIMGRFPGKPFHQDAKHLARNGR